MPIAQTLLAEFETQAPITRRYLERLPEDKLTWKPHEKSMSAGQLAYHLAFVPARRYVQPLVPASRPVQRLLAIAQCGRAGKLGPQRRRSASFRTKGGIGLTPFVGSPDPVPLSSLASNIRPGFLSLQEVKPNVPRMHFDDGFAFRRICLNRGRGSAPRKAEVPTQSQKASGC